MSRKWEINLETGLMTIELPSQELTRGDVDDIEAQFDFIMRQLRRKQPKLDIHAALGIPSP